MTTDFNGIIAIKEEIAGLSGVIKALSIRVTNAEKIMTEAEMELNALRKLWGFADSEMDRKREVLRRLEKETEKK